MIFADIIDKPDIWGIFFNCSVAFIRLNHANIALVKNKIRDSFLFGIVEEQAAVNHTRLFIKLVQDIADHSGGCGFAGSSADGNIELIFIKELSQKLGPCFYGDI